MIDKPTVEKTARLNFMLTLPFACNILLVAAGATAYGHRLYWLHRLLFYICRKVLTSSEIGDTLLMETEVSKEDSASCKVSLLEFALAESFFMSK